MWYELGNVAYVGSGYAFRGKVESDPNGTLVILQQKDISNLVSMTSEQLAEDVPQGAALAADTDNFDKYRVIKGDVLLQLRGGQFLSVVFKANYPAIAAQGVAVIRPNAGLLPSYLCWFLNHPSTTEKLRSISGGTHIPFISKKA
ncbi:MAG: restriction endonuclease subunit S, partial [Pseudomonadota bacterium]|nr:restriction endonuclease subunit S [Pseudomonadota bacterium]